MPGGGWLAPLTSMLFKGQLLSGSVWHVVFWPYYSAYCSLLDTILIAAMNTQLIVAAMASVLPYRIGMASFCPDTTPLSDILYFLHESPSWSPYCNKRLTRITQPNPSTSPLPSAPSTCWKIFDQWRNRVLREANKALETSNSISTKINEYPDWLPLLETDSEDKDWPELLTDFWFCSPVHILRRPATNFCTLTLPYLTLPYQVRSMVISV